MNKWFSILLLILLTAMLPVLLVLQKRSAIYSNVDVVEPVNVVIVFGAGITPAGEPSDALRDRLSVAADLYHREKVREIIVSGDNRFEEYSEPDVMRATLVEDFKVTEEDIHVDYAGRRTYDTCIRAHALWGVDHAVLVTQGYHLPRAIWTCEQLGIKSTGVSATLRPYVYEWDYKVREVLAMYKMWIDLYLVHPDYVGGEVVGELDP